MGSEGKRVNCTKCNKALKRVKRYYRNGRYYCNKKCFADATQQKSES